MTSTADETIARLKEQAAEEAGDETEVEAEEEEAPTKKHGDSNREYVVLQAWTETARVSAASSDAAIKQLSEDKLKNGAKYVVVPVRNWNEHEVEVETRTTISVK